MRGIKLLSQGKTVKLTHTASEQSLQRPSGENDSLGIQPPSEGPSTEQVDSPKRGRQVSHRNTEKRSPRENPESWPGENILVLKAAVSFLWR